MSSIVYRGRRASADVVAGFLRASGLRLVEVVPPTPYPAGPLGDAFVRVMEGEAEAGTLVHDRPEPRRRVYCAVVPLVDAGG